MSDSLLLTFVFMLAGTIVLWAAWNDARRFRLPNVASLALVALFPVYGYFSPSSVAWAEHLVVALLVLGGGYILFLKNWAGAGDVKFAAALSLWAGPALTLHFLFVMAMAGGILSLGIGAMTLIRQKMAKDESAPTLAKTPVPYGIAIAVAGIVLLIRLSHPNLLPSVGV